MTTYFRQVMSYAARENVFAGAVEIAGVTVTRSRDRTLTLDLRQVGEALVLEVTDRAEDPEEPSTATLIVADSLESLEEALTRERRLSDAEAKLLRRARRVLGR